MVLVVANTWKTLHKMKKVLASKSTHITQITVVECGDLFKTYEVRARGIYGLGFTETYKQKYRAFATFNLMCATLRLTGLELNVD